MQATRTASAPRILSSSCFSSEGQAHGPAAPAGWQIRSAARGAAYRWRRQPASRAVGIARGRININRRHDPDIRASGALEMRRRSVPPGRPGRGVGVKKINVPPYSPPAKLKPAAANPPSPILDSPDRAESKIGLGGVAGPGSGYEQAVTSCTLVRARVPRGFRARGIFLKKSLS